ncbi:MAG: response regulator transcription factor [Hydrogenophaga sp.]|jgi:two-component system nitrate/nitrite response regulator NarL|nr:response regulator transcription factor [Hydrogenophaga sp.]
MSIHIAQNLHIRLLLVDDHNLFRRGLKALLSQDQRFEVVGEAGDIGEALRSLAQHQPDVILLDNHLPGVRGVEGIPALKDVAPQARILMLTVSEDENDLAAALQAGADGYLLKTVESDQLCETIVKVLDGEPVISPEMLTKLVSVFRARPVEHTAQAAPRLALVDKEVSDGLAPLSPREREIMLLIARGDSNKAIARALDIAETTVKIHVQHILRKLSLSSRVQVAVYATSRGMV